MYQHIIWDFDGTLYDTYPVIAESFRLALEEEGFQESYDDILKITRVSMVQAHDYYKEKYKLQADFFVRYKEHCHEMERRLCKPYEGMADLCRYIHETGRKNYLYTHRSDTALTYLQDHGLYQYFSDFITSKSSFERKPSPAGLLYYIEKYHMKPEEAIMIGDREIDILAGKNAGMKTCFFSELGETCEIADYNVKSALEIKAIL